MKKYIPQVIFDLSNNILSHFANLSLNLIDIDRFFYIFFKSVPLLCTRFQCIVDSNNEK